MKVLVIRSPYVTYSRETIEGYRVPDSGVDVRFYRRIHPLDDTSRVRRVFERGRYTHILDLSCSFDFGSLGISNGWNSPDIRDAVTTPGSLRRTMPEALPSWPEVGDPYWVKRPGQGGRGKRLYNNWPGTRSQDDWIHSDEDIQKHIEGTEYRVNTVGDRVVQAHRKSNRVFDGRNRFDYQWCGVDGIRRNGIIPLIKDNVTSIPNWERSVLAWDIISSDEGAFVIEVNTSPGMNPATAGRIYRAMEDVNG